MKIMLPRELLLAIINRGCQRCNFKALRWKYENSDPSFWCPECGWQSDDFKEKDYYANTITSRSRA